MLNVSGCVFIKPAPSTVTFLPNFDHSAVIEGGKRRDGVGGDKGESGENSSIDNMTGAQPCGGVYAGFVNFDSFSGGLRGLGDGGDVIPVVTDFLELLEGGTQRTSRCLHAPISSKLYNRI